MERVWLTALSARRAHRHRPGRVCLAAATMFDEACAAHGNLPAYQNFGATLDLRAARRPEPRVRRMAAEEIRARAGDRVALMMPNVLQYPIALFGMLRAGHGGRQHQSALHRRASSSTSSRTPARRPSSSSRISRTSCSRCCRRRSSSRSW